MLSILNFIKQQIKFNREGRKLQIKLIKINAFHQFGIKHCITKFLLCNQVPKAQQIITLQIRLSFILIFFQVWQKKFFMILDSFQLLGYWSAIWLTGLINPSL